VGTILMVAVTVIIGATVYAGVNAYGSKGVKESTSAAFKAQAIDTDGNGRTDGLTLNYLTGPKAVPASDVAITLTKADGSAVSTMPSGHAAGAAWNPGDFLVYKPGAGNYLVSISVQGTTVVTQALGVDE
jgi:FlaG/FlaF family flagellin (archaellin)